MITLNHWRAEWLKTRRSPLNRVLFWGPPLAIAVLYTILTVLALIDPGEYQASARRNLPFPRSLSVPIQLLFTLGSTLAIVFVAASIGGEYSRDTWKMILPRSASRLTFLGAKGLAFLAAVPLAVAMFLAAAALTGMLEAVIYGMDPIGSLGDSGLAANSRLLGITLLAILFYGCLTMASTVLTRSAIGGIITSIMVSQLGLLVAGTLLDVSHEAALALPALHLQNIQAEWGTGTNGDFSLERLIGYPIAPATSTLVILAYAALFVLLAGYTFRRRDMAG